MTYELSKRSKDRLSGVHPDLVKVVERAIEITTVDFTVLEGLRDPALAPPIPCAGTRFLQKVHRSFCGAKGQCAR